MTTRRRHDRTRQPARAAAAIAAAAALACAGCASEAPPRPQLVVVVDTDAPVSGQVLADPMISGDAVIDTLLVDVVDDEGGAYEYRAFIGPDPGDWPISFGVATPEAGDAGRVTLRIRAFRGGLSTSEERDGEVVLEPRREIAIDRLADLALPADGVQAVLVRLSFECLGVSPSFLSRTSCVDAARPEAPATEGIEALEEGELPPSRVGSAALAREIPCDAPGPEDSVCIPGGFSVLGDPALWGVADGSLEDSLPLRPAVISPFRIDRNELSVGRFRALLASGAAVPELPVTRDTAVDERRYCTFLGANDPANDALPLNCLTVETAAAICEALGGALPTEAQWEHAARGRGQARSYPWGDDPPSCCAASSSRYSLPEIQVECQGQGPEPVGSHPASESCGGLGDVSRDGVLDLGGGVTEILRDHFRPFDHACWGSGILRDPICDDASATARAARGGNWSSGLTTTLAPLRQSATIRSATDGLRCVYEVAP